MINVVAISGNLTRDVKFTPKVEGQESPQDRVWGSIAHNDPFTKRANYFTFVAWGSTARAIAAYTEKGKRVHLQGKLTHRSVGEGTERRDYVEINVDRCEFGPSSKKNQPGNDQDELMKRLTTLEEAAGIETSEPAPENANLDDTQDTGDSNPF